MGTNYAYGPESWMSVSSEATWGTFIATGQKYCRIHGESMKKDRGIKAITSVLSAAPGNNRIVSGFEKVGGDVEPECLYEGGILLFLKNLFGACASSGSALLGYTHVFSLATALPTGLSVEISKGNFQDTKVSKYAGCMVTQGVFTWAAEDLWRQAYTLIAKTEEHNQTRIGSPTYATDEPVYWWYSGTFTFAGTAGVKIKSGSLTINNALDDSRFLFEKTISQPYRNGKRTISGSFTLELTDWALYDKYIADTEGTFVATFTSPTQIPSSSPAKYYTWTINAPNCRIVGNTPIVNTEGIIEWTLDFVCRAPSTGNDEMTMTVLNGQATVV
jgi:hypothetical protein